MNQLAVVAVVSPLEVRLQGATVNTPVHRRTVAVPVGLAVGQRVVVSIIDRQLTFMGRWEVV